MGINLKHIKEFPYDEYVKIPVLETKKVNTRDCVCAFDIETSKLVEQEQAFMYEWNISIDINDNIETYYGRYWDEFKDFIEKLNKAAQGVKQVIYVHNLSYEFSFLKGVLHFNTKDVMNIKSRTPLKARYKNIEFRCSYKHSNMNLDTFVKKMGARHRKLKGRYDYEKVRYPWTHLSKQEWKYCIYDTISLVEAIKLEMERDGDDLNTIPLTSTGYLRRECKKNIYEHDIAWVKAILPDYDIYKILKEAFSGGYTHANRYFVGQILDNVHSMDRSSSYPHVQTFLKFPISKFVRLGSIPEEMLQKKKGKKAILMRVQYINLRLKDEYFGMPYFSVSKLRGAVGAKVDNGKVLEAETFETSITDIDYWVIKDIYDYDSMIILDSYEARYGYLPPAIVDLLVEYYNAKTNLKNVDEYLYVKSKNKLNSGYGMTAQDIARKMIMYVEDGRTFEPEKIEERTKFENCYAYAWLPYQWGVWTTALARQELYVGIMEVYKQGLKDGITEVIYCDTDSVKYIGNKVDMTFYNKVCVERGENSKKMAIHEKTGKKYYMGVFEYEGKDESKPTYKKFATMGAKKYCYVEQNGEFHITISGVRKDLGAKEMGRIENFKEGYVFEKAASMELKYNDNINFTVEIDKQHKLEIVDNVYMYNSTYTLGYEKNYKKLLSSLKKHLDNGLALY